MVGLNVFGLSPELTFWLVYLTNSGSARNWMGQAVESKDRFFHGG